MSLRRLLAAGLSAASGRPRFRSLSTTTASHPPWAMVDRLSLAYKSQPPTFHLAEPPRYSYLQMPAELINTSAEPGPDSDSEQLLGGFVSSSSGADGLLLVMCCDARLGSPILAQQGGKQVRHRTGKLVEGHKPDFTYLVCNPLSGQVSRAPHVHGTTKIWRDPYMGLLTQASRGYGLPDRFVIAQLLADNKMLRFRSETDTWDLVEGTPELRDRPFARAIAVNQEAVAFGGRLWWVDLSCKAVSVDPFSDRPESRFVELPKASVLPGVGTLGFQAWMALRDYRRMGVSEGRLRYAEVSQREPFVLSSFALDEEGGGDWTLEHRVALSRVWAADEAVDMEEGMVIGSSPRRGHGLKSLGFIPCVLGSRQIPSTGMGVSENQSFAHVRVHSNCQWKYEEY
ncbi:unnamed protein product [Alopecurus aequalis]